MKTHSRHLGCIIYVVGLKEAPSARRAEMTAGDASSHHGTLRSKPKDGVLFLRLLTFQKAAEQNRCDSSKTFITSKKKCVRCAQVASAGEITALLYQLPLRRNKGCELNTSDNRSS